MIKKEISEQLTECAQKYKEMRLFLLFGSRAQGQAREDSDWDFGYVADKHFDSQLLYTDLVITLRTDHIDLVDLTRASGLLRFRVAKDNLVLYDNPKGQYQKFWFEAVSFWCDAGSIIREEYKKVLEDLTPCATFFRSSPGPRPGLCPNRDSELC